jgi:hypothetical protein
VPRPSGRGSGRGLDRWRRRLHGSRLHAAGVRSLLIGALLVMIITDTKPAAIKLRRAALMLIPLR